MRYLIKVGGSLTREKKVFKKSMKAIEELSNENELIILAGGGEIADCVRNIDKRFGVGDEISHAMALTAMDALGYMIAGFSPKFRAVNVKSVGTVNGYTPVLLPTSFILKSHMKPSWDNTSDSIAAYIAASIGISELILLKDVDGLFDKDPKKAKGHIIRNITPQKLSSMGETCVDRRFHRYVQDGKLRCAIINGREPKRLREYLTRGFLYGTLITCDDETSGKPSR
jgi:5-(aminomethyl)-3-furanmethanol phosphate kinase